MAPLPPVLPDPELGCGAQAAINPVPAARVDGGRSHCVPLSRIEHALSIRAQGSRLAPGHRDANAALDMGQGVIMFHAMRRAATVALWLAVILGMLFPMVAPNQAAHAGTAAHDHGGSHHMAAPAHTYDAECGASGCADMPEWQGCLDGALHCITALLGPGSDASLIRLPRDAGHRLYPVLAAPHRTPEAEVPPPRF